MPNASRGFRWRCRVQAGYSTDAIKVFSGINTTLFAAALVLVLVLLVLIYRSPVFWIIPILSVVAAEQLLRAAGYALTAVGVTVNGQTAGIALILVFGAGTDYALLLVARYREELRRNESTYQAMRLALAGAAPAIVASGGTVIAALLVVTLAEVNSTAGLGPLVRSRGGTGHDLVPDAAAGAASDRRATRLLAVRPSHR